MTLRAVAPAAETSIEIQNQSALVAIPAVPTVLIFPTVISQRGSLTYNTSTGVFLVGADGLYTSTFSFNVSVVGAQTLYFYFEMDTGSGFVPGRYTARRLSLLGTTDGQVVFASTNFFPKGVQIRAVFWVAGVGSLTTTDVPGTVPGTITVPAARMQVTGVS